MMRVAILFLALVVAAKKRAVNDIPNPTIHPGQRNLQQPDLLRDLGTELSFVYLKTKSARNMQTMAESRISNRRRGDKEG